MSKSGHDVHQIRARASCPWTNNAASPKRSARHASVLRWRVMSELG